MKKLIIPIISLTLTLTANAKKVDLLVLDDNIDTSSLEENFDVKRGSTLKSYLPPKDLRDDFLQYVPESKAWDEYQKDAFYMDIKNKSLEELQKKYPKFNKEKFKALKGKL